jgi:glycerol kinase
MAEKKYAAAVDQGTTGTRFMVFSHDGKVVSSDYQEHEQIYPKPGWVEHSAMEIWSKTQQVIKAAMEKKAISADEISGIGVTNQRETTVVWEKKTGSPVYNAIVWQDTRTRDICQKLIDEKFEPTVKRKTGLVIATYFSGPKIQWILDNVKGARAAAEKGDVLFGNIDSWVIWWLTGGPNGGAHVTDYSNASRTMLMDLKKLDWDDELLKKLRVPRAMLPQIRPSSDKKFYGTTKRNGPVGGVVPVCADLGDQQAALFGQTCYSVGEAKNTYGTGNFMLLNTGTSPVPSKSGLLTTAGYGLEAGKCVYALEGSIAITGAAIQWLRDNLGIIKNASETEEIAKSVQDSGGIYFVPAFSGLFAPHWDMYARGAVVGLTRYVTKAHLVRATLEAICYQTKEVADAMEADSGVKLKKLKVDGGAVKNDFLMQLQADVLGVQVIRPTVQETTSLGAAYGAGLATGFWSTLDELRTNWQVDRVFDPQWSKKQRDEGLAGWKKAVNRTLNWVEKEPAKTGTRATATRTKKK